MKTRQEMIYDFMVALASNAEMTQAEDERAASNIYKLAAALADKYLENV